MNTFINSNELGLLDESLRIKCILGEGGYSTVYKVKDEDKNKEYAAKIIKIYCKDEYKINQILSNTNNKHFIKLISYSQGDLKLKAGTDFNITKEYATETLNQKIYYLTPTNSL